MKILKVAAPLCLIAAGCIFFVGCDKDSDPLDESSDLDANHMVRLSTRNAPIDIITNNSPQVDPNKVVPKEENECMLNAMLQIAVDKNMKVYGKSINGGHSASSAYAEVKEHAMNYIETDENGNRDPNYEQYEGGAMVPSLAAKIGKESGILSGNTLPFNSYEEMQAYVSSPEWRSNHPDGTYIISSEGQEHASICTGFDKKGNVKIKSAQDGSSTMKSGKKEYTGFTVVY
jgi:hypothetical protein